MDPTTRRDDELAQQAPLVPDIGRGDDPRTDGGRERTVRTRATPRATPTGSTTRYADDELAQQAPLVPDLGRRGARRTATDATDTSQ